jgi:hypothetical protein
MTTFALITEGVTDQVMLKHLLTGFYGRRENDPIDINPIQPLRDATDSSRQGNFGGWELVLECVGDSTKIENSLMYNDYLIIQIDTDSGEHTNYGVPLHSGGDPRPVADVLFDVKKKLVSCIGDKVYEENKERIFFAIAFHSSECWIIHLHSNEKADQKRVLNCEEHLSRALAVKGVKYTKDHDLYDRVCKPFRKAENINLAKSRNESLDAFIASLPNIGPDEPV